jgi:hypothetical protein
MALKHVLAYLADLDSRGQLEMIAQSAQMVMGTTTMIGLNLHTTDPSALQAFTAAVQDDGALVVFTAPKLSPAKAKVRTGAKKAAKKK